MFDYSKRKKVGSKKWRKTVGKKEIKEQIIRFKHKYISKYTKYKWIKYVS